MDCYFALHIPCPETSIFKMIETLNSKIQRYLHKCRSKQNFYTEKNLEKKRSATVFFQYLTPNYLFVYNPFEVLSIKIRTTRIELHRRVPLTTFYIQYYEYSARRLIGSRIIESVAYSNQILMAPLYFNSTQNTLVN